MSKSGERIGQLPWLWNARSVAIPPDDKYKCFWLLGDLLLHLTGMCDMCQCGSLAVHLYRVEGTWHSMLIEFQMS